MKSFTAEIAEFAERERRRGVRMRRNVEIKARLQGRWDEVEKRGCGLAQFGAFCFGAGGCFLFLCRGVG